MKIEATNAKTDTTLESVTWRRARVLSTWILIVPLVLTATPTAVSGDAANTAEYFSQVTSKKSFASFMSLSGRCGSLRIIGMHMDVNATYMCWEKTTINRIEIPPIINAKMKYDGETKPKNNTTRKIHWRPGTYK